MSVTVNQTVIDLGGSGLRGRDGLTGDYLRLTQTNASGSAIQAEVNQIGAAFGGSTLFGLEVGYTTSAESMTLEIQGFNDGDARLVKIAGSDTNFNPAGNAVGDFLLFSFINAGTRAGAFEVTAPGLAPATGTEVVARSKADVAVTPAGFGTAVESVIAPLDWALRHGVPNPSKKVVFFKQAAHRILQRVPLKYDAGANASNSDYAEYEMVDSGQFQSPAITRCWSLNSIRQMVDGRLLLHSHFSFDSLSGSTWNNGMGPSTMEFAIELGEAGTTVNGTNFPFKGPWHGGMGYVSSQIFIDGSGAVDYAVSANCPVGLIVWCNGVSYQQIFTLLVGSAIACRVDLTHDFQASNASGQCLIEHTLDFTHASVTTVDACIRTGYNHMLPFTGTDFVKKTGGTAVDIIADADGNIAHGKATQVAHYRSTVPTALVEVLLSYGFCCRIGTSVGTLADNDWTYCDPSQYVVTLVNAGYGGKTYFAFCTQPGGAGTVTSFKLLVVRSQAFYRVKSGTPA